MDGGYGAWHRWLPIAQSLRMNGRMPTNLPSNDRLNSTRANLSGACCVQFSCSKCHISLAVIVSSCVGRCLLLFFECELSGLRSSAADTLPLRWPFVRAGPSTNRRRSFVNRVQYHRNIFVRQVCDIVCVCVERHEIHQL